MAVAWIGSRETQFERAVEHVAALLDASKCPVITFDTDVHGTRAAIALAERIGAAYDVADSVATAREAALITDRGAMTVAPGEVRRRADMLVLVGPVPEVHAAWIAELAGSLPDLVGGKRRKLFTIGTPTPDPSPQGGGRRGSTNARSPFPLRGAVRGGGAVDRYPSLPSQETISVGRLGVTATLAALRAHLAGRQTTIALKGFATLADALVTAAFPVFLYSGAGLDSLALEMLQGLASDLNTSKRASALHLPASENGWGSVLASTWMTGFAPRTSFARGYPEFDPWRFDIGRMVAAGEADVVLSVGNTVRFNTATLNPSPNLTPLRGGGYGSAGAKSPSPLRGGVRGGGISKSGARDTMFRHIALANTSRPLRNAAVTIAIGSPGIDHDRVGYSAQLGTIGSSIASGPSELPSAATVLRALHQGLVGKAASS